jgi:hypothetical protein
VAVQQHTLSVHAYGAALYFIAFAELLHLSCLEARCDSIESTLAAFASLQAG